MNPIFPPEINEKLECLKTLSDDGFTHSSLKYLSRFSNGVQTRRGYSRFDKTLSDIINDCVKTTRFNLVMSNVPESDEDFEQITSEHIQDTLSEFGDIIEVVKISKSTYFVRVKTYEEAVEIASQINKMLIGKNVLEVYAVDNKEEEVVEPKIEIEIGNNTVKFQELFDLLYYSFGGFMMFFAMMYMMK